MGMGPPGPALFLGVGVCSAGTPLPAWQCSALWDPNEVSLQHHGEIRPPHLAHAGDTVATKDQMWLSPVGKGEEAPVGRMWGLLGGFTKWFEHFWPWHRVLMGVDLYGCCGHPWVQCYIHLLSAPPCWPDKALLEEQGWLAAWLLLLAVGEGRVLHRVCPWSRSPIAPAPAHPTLLQCRHWKFSAHLATKSPLAGVGNTVSFIQRHRKHPMEPPAPHSVAHLQSGRWGCCASGRRSLLCPWHEELGAAHSAETDSFFQFSLSLGWFNDLGLCRTAGKPADVGRWRLDGGAAMCFPTPPVYGHRDPAVGLQWSH